MTDRKTRIAALAVVCALVALLISLVAWAATPAPSPPKAPPIPGWALGAIGTSLLLLIGAAGYMVKRWMERREAREDLLLQKLDALDRRLDRIETEQAVIGERVASLPCRKESPGNGVAAVPVCPQQREAPS